LHFGEHGAVVHPILEQVDRISNTISSIFVDELNVRARSEAVQVLIEDVLSSEDKVARDLTLRMLAQFTRARADAIVASDPIYGRSTMLHVEFSKDKPERLLLVALRFITAGVDGKTYEPDWIFYRDSAQDSANICGNLTSETVPIS
jgi:hypothetical protein